MRIQTLKLSTFRNLAAAQVNVPARDGGQLVVLVGENGAGKTSVLEALSLLSPGRGLHKAKPAEMAQDTAKNGKNWGVFAQLAEGTEVGQALQKGKRVLKIDHDITEKQSTLATLGNVMWLAPLMDRIFLDGAAARRDFLDRLVYGLNPAHAETMNRYKHHLKNRLQLLKQGHLTGDWLELEEAQAAKFGIEVLHNRQAYLAAFNGFIEDVELHLTGATLAVLEEADAAAALAGKFERSRPRDAEIGATHTGAQKVDLAGVLKLPERDVPLSMASSGQHKRALVNVVMGHAKLIHAKTGAAPLVLIDEIGAHLDAVRRKMMLDCLLELGAQIWVTEVDKSIFDHVADNAFFIDVKSGTLSVAP